MDTIYTSAIVALLGAPAAASLWYAIRPQTDGYTIGRISIVSAAIAWLAALALAYGVFMHGAIDEVFAIVGNPQHFHFYVGAWIDRLSIISVLLVTTIGLIVQRYSLRYLQGDPNQGRFFSWLSFVLGAVTLFVISRNLLALTLSWFAVSFGVHRLLLHFPEREAAQKAAWRKFVVSRLGDVALVAALVVTYLAFGTFELKAIFDAASAPGQLVSLRLFGIEWSAVAVAGALYVAGAMTKSAQFPFHIWLPDTMETPTPVSALMHAGIINAGGFLVVRLSPIVSHALVALDVLFLFGALTALFGGLIYLVQTDVKRSLAYSTVAQMGYMMMQCGLGAFSAAVMHLVMHGFYKANAFLSAAGTISKKPLLEGRDGTAPASPSARLMAMLVAAVIVYSATWLLNVDVNAKAGGPFLCLFLWFSATQAIAPVWNRGKTIGARLTMTAMAYVGVALYWTLLGAFSGFLEPLMNQYGTTVDQVEVPPTVLWVVAATFVLTFVATEFARARSGSVWAQRWYVLCLNHFYVEHAWKRVVGVLLKKTTMLPAFETSAVPENTGR